MKTWLILLVASTIAEALPNCVSQISLLECTCRDGLENAVITTQHSMSEDGKWQHTVAAADPTCNNSITFDWLRHLYEDSLPRDTAMIRKGYERFGNSLYKFHTISQTWENARRTCEKEGAHLAIINSDPEAQFLQQIYTRYPSLTNVVSKDFAFIGFHDLYQEGEYLTIFGEPIDKTGYSTWFVGTPDNLGWNNNGHPGEDCGSMHRDGRLNDVPCEYLLAFICELEDNPAPLPHGIDYSSGAYKGVEKVIKPPPGTVPRTDAGEGYEFFPGIGFYRFHTNTDVWENARRTCEKEGAHLAIVNSEAEAQVLSLIFMKHPFIKDWHYDNFAFVGFHDQFSEGNYVTIYGEPLTSTGYYRWWKAGEPNNEDASNTWSGEDCGAFYKNGGYNDVLCNMKQPFFCEKELLQ